MVGGVENVTVLLATALVAAGCRVTVGTSTAGELYHTVPFDVVRCPSMRQLWKLYQQADVIVLQGLSLNLGWPAFFTRKPVFVVHHLLYDAQRNGFLRRSLFNRATNIAVSEAVKASLPGPAITFYNPYDAEVFYLKHEPRGEKTLLFVGRLVPEKGIMDLLTAMVHLRESYGLQPRLTIVGDGPLKKEVSQYVARSGLAAHVELIGERRGEPLSKQFNSHEVAVIPSAWEEPFGIVALEAIACGCLVVGTRRGGLAEAIGPCGVTVENGDAVALAGALRDMLTEPPSSINESVRKNHLQRFQPEAVADRFLKLFESNLSKTQISASGVCSSIAHL